MRCTKCATEGIPGKKFCAECGSPLSNRCPNCRSDNAPGAKFCADCGNSLGKEASTEGGKSSATQAAGGIRIAPEGQTSEAIDGERKTVTVLVADIKGSMEMIEDLDPEDARAIVDPALKLMMDAVHRYEGYVAQSTGDGIFALFGAPVAQEDHPQRALYAALRMQEDLRRYSDKLREQGQAPLYTRVGVNTGDVVVRMIKTDETRAEYVPIGHSVSVAARLQALAAPGSVAISEAVRKLVEGYFVLKPLGPARIKGVSEPLNIYEVTGLGPLRTRLQRSAGRGLSKFVGREREMQALRAAAEQARAGHGQVVAAVAEAGTVKSRLFFEFKAVAQSGWMVLETLSLSYGKASAYLPVINLLYGYFRIATEDDARTRREKITGRVLALERSLEDALPYLFGLLGLTEGNDPLAGMDAQVRKRRTLDVIKRLLLRESLNQPLTIIFEDLHWIDDETRAFLNLFADSIGTAKILLLVNYRPEYSHSWSSKTYYTQLRLDPLGRESAGELLDALLGNEGALQTLKRLIIDKTLGNPFFIEETVQVLFDQRALVRNGTVTLTRPLSELSIPPTVQMILASRIDRLPADEKDLLQTLAVVGKDFTLSLVRAITGRVDDDLGRMLKDLQLGEFIYEQPAMGDVEYTFKHALTREVAYGSILNQRRKLLHDRAGEAIEGLFAGRLDDHFNQLAHHFTQSVNADKAVRYLTLAGKQARDRSAFAESQAQLQKGLEWIKALPEAPERDARELELASALAQVLFVTIGFTAPETVEAAARARTLAERSGNLAQLVLQGFGIWRSVFVSGDHPSAVALADQILDLAQREGSDGSLAFAHSAQLIVRFNRGDLVGVEEHFARMNGFFEAVGFRQFPGAVSTLFWASLSAWIRGHADSARERIAHASAVVRDNKNPYDLAVGRFYESWLYRCLREPQRAESAATQALALAEEHGFSNLRGIALVNMGWARAQLGSTGEGVSLTRKGLAGLAEIGARLYFTDFLTGLAEAQALDGAIDDALVTVENALQTNPEEAVWRPSTLTCRGELRHKTGQTELAAADFREAIGLAQKMSAKAWELRAAVSLTRLLKSQSKHRQARAMLADIYGWFTEGFGTADLKDAKALLDELNE